MLPVSDWESKYRSVLSDAEEEQIHQAAEQVRAGRIDLSRFDDTEEEKPPLPTGDWVPPGTPRVSRREKAEKMAKVYACPKARAWILKQMGVSDEG